MADQKQLSNSRQNGSAQVAKTCCTPARPGTTNASSAQTGYAPKRIDSKTAAKWADSFIDVPGGRQIVGTDNPMIKSDGEGPAREVRVAPFRMSAIAVTNAWFSDFIAETGYVTDAERYGWSLVFWSFADPAKSFQRVAEVPWWCKVEGADWSHPFGPNSDIARLSDHPVAHISWNDAVAFAKWMGGRLPTEAEWERAATAGDSRTYPWGELEPTDSELPCNIWQGKFPEINECADGYSGSAPVRSFKPNPWGFFNMSGNVWEWCSDPFQVKSNAKFAKQRNERARANKEKLAKGGSYLCHKSYCYRYRIAARTAATSDSSAGHMGMRVVLSP